MIQEKYIKLLLDRCLELKENTPLFISYEKINKDFVEELVNYAKEKGIKDIYLDEIDSYYIHDLLNSLTIEKIENHEEFNDKIWDDYANKNAAFLLLKTLIPGLMDDVDSKKIAKSQNIRIKTKAIYKEKQLKSLVSWCIAALPNEIWAKDIFNDCDEPLKAFWKSIEKICMLDSENPINKWDEFLASQEKVVDKLNQLKINKLHYKNDLGTDLTVELNKDSLWASASNGKGIVNLPSYEVFTSPNYIKTNGIVYSSKPLMYAGKFIDEFYLKFKDGKVVDFDAKKGKDILENILTSDKQSAYLGEVALVNFDSPISNTNRVFKSTLYDENASCHLALGNGFAECIKNGNNLSKDELKEKGINDSTTHVDFMIGTKDLFVEAETDNGTVILMKDGNIVI